MNNFSENIEYIFWTMGIGLAGIHVGLIFSINILTITMFLFTTLYAILLMAKSHMRKATVS
ncbi:MAG: hypothetical protein Phog2KO_32610 [Phototrophicaceae bacterium]